MPEGRSAKTELPLGRLGTSELCILVGDARVIFSNLEEGEFGVVVLFAVMFARARAEDRFYNVALQTGVHNDRSSNPYRAARPRFCK